MSKAVSGPIESLNPAMGELKRERILHAAAQLFANRGYHNVSMEQIGHALGITKPSIYNCFKDKNDLLYTICHRGVELTQAVLGSVQASQANDTETVRAFCRALIDSIIENRVLLKVYQLEHLNLSPEQAKELLSIRSKTDRELTALLNHISETNQAAILEPKLSATAINMMISSVILWYFDKGPGHKKRFVDTLSEYCLRIIGAPTASIEN